MINQVIGFVDGFIDGNLKGWIANLDRPSELEPIRFLGENGVVEIYHPLEYRGDVCSHLSLEGTFGFSIPLTLLTGMGRRVSVSTIDGRLLEHGERLHLPESINAVVRPETGVTAIFLHIQKTAGTSFRNDISHSYLSGQLLLIYPDTKTGVSQHYLRKVSRRQLSSFQLIFGHMYFGIHHLLRGNHHYATIIRDPIERIRSQFWHLVRLHRAGMLSENPVMIVKRNQSEEFDNLMTRSISGLSFADIPSGQLNELAVDRAINNINLHFSYIALVEDTDQNYKDLGNAIGATIHTRSTDNRAPLPTYRDIFASLQINWPELIERNRFDILLYKKIVSNNLFGKVMKLRGN